MTLFDSSNFSSDVLFIYVRDGSTNNPYIDITETITVNQDRVFLKEVPEKYSRVVIQGGTLIMNEVERKEDMLDVEDFFVDYREGVVYLHSSLNGTINLSFTYKGTGAILYPASRIYTGTGLSAEGTLITLADIIDNTIVNSDEANKALAEIQRKLAEAESDINAVKLQGDYAKAQGDYAKVQGDFIETVKNDAKQAVTDARNIIAETTKVKDDTILVKTEVEKAVLDIDNLDHKDDYMPMTAYVKNNIVSYDGGSFMCILDNTGMLPTNKAYWKPLSERGLQGGQGIQGKVGNDGVSFIWKKDYNPATTYKKDDVVFYNGSSFIALKDLSNVTPIDDNINWDMMSQRGIDGEGSVSSVNGISPDLSGNVIIPMDSPHINRDVLDGLAEDLGQLKYKGKAVGSVTSVNGQTGDVVVQGFSGAYSDLTGVPAEFNPIAHEHTIAQVTGLQTALDGKVNKVVGKQLSTEDFTTEEKNKLLALLPHPANHPPSIITQDENNRFVTDVQIAKWDAKSDQESEVAHFEYSIDAIANGQTVFEIPLATFNVKDKLNIFVNRLPLTINDYTVVGKTITLLNDVVDLGESLYIEIIKNIQKIEQKTLDGLYITDNTITESKLAFGVVKSINGQTGDLIDIATTQSIDTKLDTKVDKVVGKQLSTEDFTTVEKTKLVDIEEGAEANTVDSVNGKIGAVIVTTDDIAEGTGTLTESITGIKSSVSGLGTTKADKSELDTHKNNANIHRKITVSNLDPTGGADGDLWFKYKD